MPFFNPGCHGPRPWLAFCCSRGFRLQPEGCVTRAFFIDRLPRSTFYGQSSCTISPTVPTHGANRPGNSQEAGKSVIVPTGQACALALICALTGCGELPLTEPSPPSQLEIRGTTLLMPGSRGKLSAWLSDHAQLREVSATWRAESDAISITASGLVTANHVGGVTVHARFDDHDGVGMVHVVSSVAGTWRGTIDVVDCWPQPGAPADPCQGRVGLNAPIAVTITQSATADNFDNLRASVQVFTPPATGSFIGATDSSGQVFLDGAVARPGDDLSGAMKLRWMLEENRLVPFADSPRGADVFDVLLSTRLPAP